MSVEIDLSQVSDDALLKELAARGDRLWASVWNLEDAKGAVEEDPDCEDLTEGQLDRVASCLFAEIQDGMGDVLGERGNTYIADRWEETKAEILAEILAEGTGAQAAPNSAAS